jgi:hypothetical protein
MNLLGRGIFLDAGLRGWIAILAGSAVFGGVALVTGIVG